METKQPTPLEQSREIVSFLEKAIDVAVSKGCFNKMEVVQIVQGFQYLYNYLEDKSAASENAVPFKGIK